MLSILRAGVTASFLLGLLVVGLHGEGYAQSTKEFTVVNIESPQGVKIWVPTSLTIKKGDKISIKLINKLDAEHGYRIAGYNIEQVVPGEQAKTIEFAADKPGIFAIDCHLHPPHVAGQLIVLP